MLIVRDTPKSGVCRPCFTEKLSLLNHFNDEHLWNKKLAFNSKQIIAVSFQILQLNILYLVFRKLST